MIGLAGLMSVTAALLLVAGDGGDYRRGRDFAERYCKTCHGRPDADVPAPDFGVIARRVQGRSDDELRQVLHNPPHQQMPNYNQSNEESDDLIRYLRDVARGYPP